VSPRLPRVTADQVAHVLEKMGFQVVRQSGSHRIYRNAVGSRVTLPFHAGKILHPKVLKSILLDADLKVDEFLKLLREL
jgi:predicted RNA binding protein YcfA (HicA-like mRNA interferase family)